MLALKKSRPTLISSYTIGVFPAIFEMVAHVYMQKEVARRIRANTDTNKDVTVGGAREYE